MDRIPPEILCDIFLAALPHPTDPDEYLSSVEAPLRISHVCQTWRTLSLSFGELWSYLCVEYDSSCSGKRTTSLVAKASVFDTWIERTNGAPLNFRVNCCHISPQSTAEHCYAEHIITTMISQQHRWRDVTLTLWDVELSPECPGLNLTNMPILTSLSLDLMQSPRSKINIAQSSRLKRLHIHAADFELMTSEEPLCSYTESAEIIFRLESVSPSGSYALRLCLDVLKAAPFLTEFITCFDWDTPPQPRSENGPLIRLPNLRVLNLARSADESDDASFIIDYVTIPNLQVLFFTSCWYDEDLKVGMLTSFIRRSLPPLTTLVMYWNRVNEELIIPILHLLPTLEYLRLDGADVTSRFFHELLIPSSTGADSLPGDEYTSVCPVLKTLYLYYVDFEESTDLWVAFIAMLKSRPRGLGESNVIYLRDHYENIVLATVELSDLDENIGDSRDIVREYVQQRNGLVIGNYGAVASLQIRRY